MSVAKIVYPLSFGFSLYQASSYDDSTFLASLGKGQNLPDAKEAVKNLLQKENIRNDIIIREGFCRGFCEAKGVNFRGQAAVIVNPETYQDHTELTQFFIKREIFHIKNNDLFRYAILGVITSIALLVLFPVVSIISLNTVKVAVISSFVMALFSRFYAGRKADDFAIAHSTDEELKEAYIFFLARIVFNSMQRKSDYIVMEDPGSHNLRLQEIPLSTLTRLWRNICITKSWERRWDVSSPSLVSRVEKIKKALIDRGVKCFSEEEENRKMTPIIHSMFLGKL